MTTITTRQYVCRCDTVADGKRPPRGWKQMSAFVRAADLDGSALSQWIRNRLRRVSREELEAHGETATFLAGSGQPGV